MLFVDHRTVDWKQVRRTHYWMYQRFRYEYPGPVRELRQRLMVIPASQHGDQQLRGYQFAVSAPASSLHYEADSFGNRVFRCTVPQVSNTVDFEVWSNIERETQPGTMPKIAGTEALRYLETTRLTTPDERLTTAAHELRDQSREPQELASLINDWTFGAMRYASGVTNVGTSAAQALALGAGLCQDYAHIMLTLCRTAGLPARYVSGHLLGEGGSHAWVEVLLPVEEKDSDKRVAWAFDPTNHCRAGLGYITVAVGRDYQDVSPTSGSYIAPYQGRLVASKRVGLTAVEYV